MQIFFYGTHPCPLLLYAIEGNPSLCCLFIDILSLLFSLYLGIEREGEQKRVSSGEALQPFAFGLFKISTIVTDRAIFENSLVDFKKSIRTKELIYDIIFS